MESAIATPQAVIQAASSPRRPDRTFWEDDLELSTAILKPYTDDESRQTWVEHLNTHELTILCQALDLGDLPPRQRKDAVVEVAESLDPFILAKDFGRHMHKHAVRDVARRALDQAALKVCQKKKDEDAYDKSSLLFALLAGLSEGIIDRDTNLRLSRRSSMNLTTALAKSNNPFFANIGDKLGFEKVYYYAKLFGLGERAGFDIEGESPGIFPAEKPAGVPVGLMTSFGEAIGLTPLQLTAMVSAIANGGTLYYLQHPKTQEEAAAFTPRVKRHLDVQQWLPDLRPGMLGATDFGTARRALYDANEPIYGKTGTCTDARTHLGWFGSYNEVAGRKLVVVVLLTGGKPVNGPVASGIAGQVYRNLSEQQWYAMQPPPASSATVLNGAISGSSPEN